MDDLITSKLDIERVFKTIPLPKPYDNAKTKIHMIQRVDGLFYDIIAVNPDFVPIALNFKTEKWEEMKEEGV